MIVSVEAGGGSAPRDFELPLDPTVRTFISLVAEAQGLHVGPSGADSLALQVVGTGRTLSGHSSLRQARVWDGTRLRLLVIPARGASPTIDDQEPPSDPVVTWVPLTPARSPPPPTSRARQGDEEPWEPVGT